MRDPRRIDEFCIELAEEWKKFPDLRFGQFMCNIFGEMQSTGRDPFFPGETEMMNFIKETSKKWRGENE